MDALTGNQEEDAVEFRPEFAGSLRRSLKQVHSGKGLDVNTLREQIGYRRDVYGSGPGR